MHEPEPAGHGLREDAPPGPSVIGVAFGLGVAWGVLGYAILWEGVPWSVDRPFVQSVVGTVVLLPVRAVLWAIRRAEVIAGRTFDLSQNHWWIALAAAAIGAAIVVAATWLVRTLARRSRRPSRTSSEAGR